MAWGVVYYHAPDGSIPGGKFLDSCPTKVEATILAVLESVRRAPRPQFSGGGKWDAMHGAMIVVLNGISKRHRTEFSDRDYRKHVRVLGDDYLATLPRRIAEPDA